MDSNCSVTSLWVSATIIHLIFVFSDLCTFFLPLTMHVVFS
jgi:hypothetical protein